MVLPMVIDGMIMELRGYYNLIVGHDYRCCDPDEAGTGGSSGIIYVF